MIRHVLAKFSIPRLMYLLSALGVMVIMGVSLSGHLLVDNSGLAISVPLTAAVFLALAAYTLGRHVKIRAETMVDGIRAMAEGDLSKKCAIPGKDEFAWMAWEYTRARKQFAHMVVELQNSAGQLAAAAEQLSVITQQSKQGIRNQNGEIEQVAAAMNEMSATVHEVARSASNAAEATKEADRQAANANQVVKGTIGIINTLAQEVERTAGFISKLQNDSVSIGSVLDVIRGIAEQTNLLALNAAIEAARAGEQGRGFAVVADEVRTLASRTQQSTQEIQKMIERLQLGANDAVAATDKGKHQAHACVEQAAKAGASLEEIMHFVDRIKDMNMQIASACEEQSATAEEINRNLVNINEISAETSHGAEQTAEASDQLTHLAVQLQDLAGRFKLQAEFN